MIKRTSKRVKPSKEFWPVSDRHPARSTHGGQRSSAHADRFDEPFLLELLSQKRQK